MGFSRQEYWSGLPLPSPDLSINQAFLRRPFKIFPHQRISFAQSFMSVRRTLYFLRKQQSKYIIKQHSSDHQASATTIHTQGESVAKPRSAKMVMVQGNPFIQRREAGRWNITIPKWEGKTTVGLSSPEWTSGEGNGNSLQYSCLENPMHRGACGLQSRGSQRVRHNWLSTHTHTRVKGNNLHSGSL